MSSGSRNRNPMYEQFKNNSLREAEKIVLEEFPKKVIEFNDLLENGQFSYDRLPEIIPSIDLGIPCPEKVHAQLDDDPSSPPGCFIRGKKRKLDDVVAVSQCTPVFSFVNGTVKCNEKLVELIAVVRSILVDAVEAVIKVKMWILFLIPRIEDGNNFGVSIQEEALNEVQTVESQVSSFIGRISLYFDSRAHLVTKVAKYPHVEDYRRAILEMDQKQFISIRLVLIEMRNHFAGLHDLITKNLEKIKVPRADIDAFMY